MKRVTSITPLVLCLGCTAIGSPDEGTEVTPTETPTPTSVESPPTVGDAPAPAAPAPSSTFSVIARGGAPFRLHRLIDGGLLVSTGPLVMRVDASGEIVYDPAMLRGITPIRRTPEVGDGDYDSVADWSPVGLGGRWPDALFLSLDFSSGFRGEGGRPITYRHTPNGWTPLKTRGAKFEHHIVALQPWIDGSVLARRGYVPWFPGQERWEGEDGPTARQLEAAESAIAAAKKLVVVRGEPKAPDVGASVAAFASRRSGELVAVTGRPSPSALIIAADGTRTTVELPSDVWEIEGVVMDGPDSAWVFGSQPTDGGKPPAYLARIDHGRLTASEAPPCTRSGLHSFIALDDGTLWTTCADPDAFRIGEGRGEVWTRPPGGPWTAVQLPSGVDFPSEVYARADDDVWVAAAMKDRSVLLHTRPRARVLEVPGLAGIGRLLDEYNGLLPLTDGCSPGYVPLTAVPGDASTIRGQLEADLVAFSKRASVQLVRTTIRGAEQLGLRVDSGDTADDTRALHALVRKRLGDAAVGEARCWEPTVDADGTVGEWEQPRAAG